MNTKPKFKTQFNANVFPRVLNNGSGEILVEKAGYIDLQKRIENMMLAGNRLVEGRKEMYDFDGDVDEDFYDPTREKSFDLADASMISNDIEAKLRAFKANQNAQKASVEAAKEGGEESPPQRG